MNYILFKSTFFLFAFYTLLSSQPKWEWQNIKPIGSNLKNIFIYNENNIWISGSNGTLLNSKDGGDSWSKIEFDFSTDVGNVIFIDSLRGVVNVRDDVDYILLRQKDTLSQVNNNFIYYTNDGGISWEIAYESSDNIINNFDVLPTDKNVILASCDNYNLIKSNDGGKTWIEEKTFDTNISDIELINDNVGFACGDGIYKTQDGRKTWQLLESTLDSNTSFRKVDFINAEIGFVFGLELVNDARIRLNEGVLLPVLYKTVDAGNNWEHISDPFNPNFPTDVVFISDSIGFISTLFGEIYKTTSQYLLTDLVYFDNKSFISKIAFGDKFGIAVGDNGLILKSTSDFNNWNPFFEGFREDILSVDASINYSFAVSRGGSIIKSENNSGNWDPNYFSENSSFYDLDVINENTIYAVGSKNNEGLMVKSVDNGDNWVEIASNLDHIGNYVKFFDEKIGYASSSFNLTKTTDGGKSWEIIDKDPHAKYFFVSENIGWKFLGRIYKTNDGGRNWELSLEIDNFLLTDSEMLYFFDEDFGWLYYITQDDSYLNYKLLNTVDGGQS